MRTTLLDNIVVHLYLFLLLIATSVKPQITFTDREGGSRSVNNGGNNRNIIFDEAPPVDAPPCRTPDQRPGTCKSLAECAIFFAEIPTLLETPCSTGNGQEGVCCPARASVKSPRPGVSSSGVLTPPPPPRVEIPKVTREQLLVVVDNSIRAFTRRQQSANKILFEENIQVPKGSPSASHQRFFTSTNDILDEGNKAQLNIEASTTLVNDLKLSKLQGTFALPHISARNTLIANTCPPVATCRPGFPYRTIDGSCNNVQNPDWGKAGTAFQRILAPKYADGVSSPRTLDTRGRPLPSARAISSFFIPDENRPYNNITLMLMQWGQFLDHDLTHTPIVKGANQTSISCCQDGQLLGAQFRHPDCFPIEIPSNDPFFSQHRQQCMDFVRSLPSPRRECNFGPREQMSQITSYIDGSNVYGSSETRARNLREFQGGRLKAQRNSDRRKRELLPASPNECSDSERRRFCFTAGDVRVNEQIDLAVMHTIWLREHNRIAAELQNLNPNWSDEILFQETRRIVIAEMEHITYNEFLPLVLGPEYMRTFNMTPISVGHTTLYDPEVDPSITNAFAAAAFRFGHSLVQGVIEGVNQFGTISQAFSLTQTQFQPFPVYDHFDSFVRGLATQDCQRFDNFFSDHLTKHLFQGSSQFGLDLVALNIQRGRDHGLPSYNDWREVCSLPRINSWDDLRDHLTPHAASRIERLYQSVDDIDLYVGAVGEKPLQDAILGPVFLCLVGDQFARLRRGDRFFYEEKTARFTEGQLDQIRKVSLARVLCDNSDEITVIQPLVMQKASVLNRRLPCTTDAIPALDMSFWREFRQVPFPSNTASPNRQVLRPPTAPPNRQQFVPANPPPNRQQFVSPNPPPNRQQFVSPNRQQFVSPNPPPSRQQFVSPTASTGRQVIRPINITVRQPAQTSPNLSFTTFVDQFQQPQRQFQSQSRRSF